MFATRQKTARIGYNRAHDEAPFYHDNCWPTDADGFALPNGQGQVIVWLGRGACGYVGETCGLCGKQIA